MKKVLVTGGAGYIGSHTVVELIESGYTPVIADNLSNSSKGILAGIERITGVSPVFYQVDLCDKENIRRIFSDHPDINSVIHFAAYKAVGESVSFPLKYYANNLISLIYLLEVMNDYKVSNLIFSSSCTVYGEPDFIPVDEKAPVKKAMSPYGNTKQIAEEILIDQTSAENSSLKAIALRYFNPIGAHPTALIGELPVGVPNNLIPFITQTAYGIREELKVFGSDYNTPDGSCIRDYIDVVDLAKAHVIALARVENSPADFEVFNLGTGVGLSVLEIVNIFEKTTGKKLKYKIVGRRSGDVEKVYADPSLANNLLGWKAQIPVEETLRNAWKWENYCRKNINFFEL